MAFTSITSGNLVYVDETATWSTGKTFREDVSSLRVLGIIITPNHASNEALVEVGFANSGRGFPTILKLKVEASMESKIYELEDKPLVLYNGLHVKSLEYASVTFILDTNTKRE